MSKNRDKKTAKTAAPEKAATHNKSNSLNATLTNHNYLVSMSAAPRLGETTHWFQMLPALLFTTVIIMIVRMESYKRPMEQFYFATPNQNSLTDFFSYYKSVAIIICAVLALVLLLYKVFTQSFYIKRSFAYIPMLVYAAFVLLSYFFSKYKLFALWGWTDRFEGTVILLCYMAMLFYIINIVNSERNVKWLINLLAVTSTILGLLGITQAMNHDFFKTVIGKKLITPPSFWDHISSLNFTFTNEIYQTVYNINYVSFYLTLLIPIFGLLFIRSAMLGREEPLYKKIIWGALFTLLVFNLIGSASSGGFMGMAIVVLIGIIVLNRKLIIWWKPVVILIVITVAVAGVSYGRWMPELTNAVGGVSGKQAEQAAATDTTHKLDYFITAGNDVKMGYKGEELTFTTYPDDPASLTVTDESVKPLSLTQIKGDHPEFRIDDERYNWISVKPARDDSGYNYILIITDGHEWPFRITPNGPLYRTGLGRFVELTKVPAVGWENNQQFGSGRGYIWSRTIPMMKDTLILGHGADTYCIYFPHVDYVGKYDSGTFSSNLDIIIDKPHNMYFGAFIGTGGISVLTLLVLWGIYIVQSFIIYRKQNYTGFLSYAGAGIFLGICGFLVSGFVDDSSVSVMPMFYGLLGTGIAINIMLKNTERPA
jgi:hypothetical protein